MLEVDEEPRLVELERKRLRFGADFHPALAGILFESDVVDEAPPAMLTWVGRSPVTHAERNRAPDAEPAFRPVVRPKGAIFQNSAKDAGSSDDLSLVLPN